MRNNTWILINAVIFIWALSGCSGNHRYPDTYVPYEPVHITTLPDYQPIPEFSETQMLAYIDSNLPDKGAGVPVPSATRSISIASSIRDTQTNELPPLYFPPDESSSNPNWPEAEQLMSDYTIKSATPLPTVSSETQVWTAYYYDDPYYYDPAYGYYPYSYYWYDPIYSYSYSPWWAYYNPYNPPSYYHRRYHYGIAFYQTYWWYPYYLPYDRDYYHRPRTKPEDERQPRTAARRNAEPRIPLNTANTVPVGKTVAPRSSFSSTSRIHTNSNKLPRSSSNWIYSPLRDEDRETGFTTRFRNQQRRSSPSISPSRSSSPSISTPRESISPSRSSQRAAPRSSSSSPRRSFSGEKG